MWVFVTWMYLEKISHQWINCDMWYARKNKWKRYEPKLRNHTNTKWKGYICYGDFLCEPDIFMWLFVDVDIYLPSYLLLSMKSIFMQHVEHHFTNCLYYIITFIMQTNVIVVLDDNDDQQTQENKKNQHQFQNNQFSDMSIKYMSCYL